MLTRKAYAGALGPHLDLMVIACEIVCVAVLNMSSTKHPSFCIVFLRSPLRIDKFPYQLEIIYIFITMHRFIFLEYQEPEVDMRFI